MLLREVAAALFPARFDYAGYVPPVAPQQELAEILAPLGALNIWDTIHFKRLEAGEEHSLPRSTQSTAERPILKNLDDAEWMQFLVAHDVAYPRLPMAV